MVVFHAARIVILAQSSILDVRIYHESISDLGSLKVTVLDHISFGLPREERLSKHSNSSRDLERISPLRTYLEAAFA